MEISHDELLGEGNYANIEGKSLYDDLILAIFQTAYLNVWVRIGKIGKIIESFCEVIQGPKKAFLDFLQRLTLTVNGMRPNSGARQIIIVYLATENASAQCKRVNRPSKVRSAPLDE